jgi:hypothetical protein
MFGMINTTIKGRLPMFKFILSSIVAIFLLFPIYTKADIQYGAWVFHEGNNNGVHICAASTFGNNGQYFGIKFDVPPGNLYIHIIKNTWNIPIGTKVRIGLNVDNAPGWNFVATSFVFNGIQAGKQESGLEFTFDLNQRNPRTGEFYYIEFINLMKNGVILTINFLDGNEGVWYAYLNGSNNAITDMQKCILRQFEPTQPFNRI